MLVKSVSVCIYDKLATWAGTQPPLQLSFQFIVSEKAKQRVVLLFFFLLSSQIFLRPGVIKPIYTES